MPLFNWEDKYKVGIPEVDRQHQEFFRIVRALDEAVRTGREDEMLALTVQSLIDYAQWHFAEEEQAMLANGFPGYEAHKADHDRLREMLAGYQRYLKEKSKLVAEILPFLVRDWLEGHIPMMDRQAAAYLATDGEEEPLTSN